MIVTKTPFRISFVGGGSDLPSFYRQEGGAVLSTSVNKYMYICLNRKFDGRIRVSYSRTEEVDDSRDIIHPLVRECLKLVNIDRGVEIASMADIPSKGSGLGSSSAYTVGLLNALFTFQNQRICKEELANLACQIEIERCGEPIGKQDQYGVAIGGLNLIRFNSDDSVSVEPVVCSSNVVDRLESSMIVFFTGRTRSASAVLAAQDSAMKLSAQRGLLRRMVQLAFEMKKGLEQGSVENVGELLDENWRLKTQIAHGISDAQIDRWYSAGIANGATGGKILGAGNGGFLLFLAPLDRHDKIRYALKDLQEVQFRFDTLGTQLVFSQPN
jgi:D-glycero-alpha-D-manno-heptose-7-phosphate kinase